MARRRGVAIGDGGRPVVLVVEDEPDLARTYELWLEDDYEIRLAEDGEEGLAQLDASVDVVLLDRKMPGMSGDEVLERIRAGEHDPMVAMVTAVDPGFDIIEMGFDDYLTKPPTRDEMFDLIEDLLARTEYADQVQEYQALVAKKETLSEEMPVQQVEPTDQFDDLVEQIDDASEALEDSQERLLDDAEFVSTLRDVTEGSGGGS